MYYPCSENKGADQLCGHREADLRLCFRLCRLLVFPCGGSFYILTFLYCDDTFSDEFNCQFHVMYRRDDTPLGKLRDKISPEMNARDKTNMQYCVCLHQQYLKTSNWTARRNETYISLWCNYMIIFRQLLHWLVSWFCILCHTQ